VPTERLFLDRQLPDALEPSPIVPAGDTDAASAPTPAASEPLPRLSQRPAGRRLARKPEAPPVALTPEQRLLVLDAWNRSGLPAGDFAPLVHLSKHTLYAWKKKFDRSN
jgi:hypothetical protein